MNDFIEKSTQADRHLSVDSINLAALRLHNKTVLASKSDEKTALGFYGINKKLKALMPLPFLRKSGMVRLIINKVQGLGNRKNQKVLNSSLTLKPAHSKRVRLRRYIHRLVRRRS